jgi:hypothetical protein
MKATILILSLISFSSAIYAQSIVKVKFCNNRAINCLTLKPNDDITKILKQEAFDAAQHTVIFCHGYSWQRHSRAEIPITEGVLSTHVTYNVVFLDFTKQTKENGDTGSAITDEVIAKIGAEVTTKLLALYNTGAVDFNKITLLGYGIGVFILGQVATNFQNQVNFTFPRLTALDPAGNNFKKIFDVNFNVENLPKLNKSCVK